jgi:hypothetical protein
MKRKIILLSILLLFANITLITKEPQSQVRYLLGKPIIESSEGYFEGYNLFILERRNISDYTTVDKTLFIVDMDGKIIIEKDVGTDAFLGVEFINSTTLLYGNYEGGLLWNIETDVEEQLHFKGHHEYEWNPIDNTYFTLNQYLVFYDGLDYVYDRIAEFTPEGEMIWSVNMSEFVPFEHWCPFQGTEYEGMADITHANSIFYDDVEDVIYVNCRNTNTFYKIDHETGELLWSLGEYGDFELYDIEGNLKESLFYHGHALEKINDDTFIYFDNDQHNQEDAQNRESRIIEIQIDEVSREARIIWQWVSSDEYHSAWWGDADLLPNGNRLGTFGTLDHSGSTSIGARLVEVSNEGDIVWEMKYPKDGDIAHGVYRMERIDFAPILQVNETYWIKSGEEAIVYWEAFYNYRNKYEQSGLYSIFFEGIEIETNSVNFERYWQPTEKSINLGLLEDGNYNVTFVIQDEISHLNSQCVNLTVSKYTPDVGKTEGFALVSVLLPCSILMVLVIRKRFLKNKNKLCS